jgi:hypothetical protein
MRDSCFIVLSKYGIERMTKRCGSLKRGEVSVKVWLTIGVKHFEDPAIVADIAIADSAVIYPVVAVYVEDAPTNEEPS